MISDLKDELSSVDPLKEPRELSYILWKFLKPRARPAPRVHLLTINGLTYPIHRDFGFAAVPDPTEVTRGGSSRLKFVVQRSKRRYSMLAYLFSMRPGDLIFFFQADPQPLGDILNRRGFRGIWIVASEPFRDVTAIKHPQTGYEILGECPQCGSPFNFGKDELVKGSRKCLLCEADYGSVNVGARRYSRVVLSARLLIEPLVVFKKTAGDNRVYSDLITLPLIWISRTDNAMGPGKGSSIRTLLPEEAVKIAFMLATEEHQAIDDVKTQPYPGSRYQILDYNDQPVTFLRAVYDDKRRDWVLDHELHLNLYFAMNIDFPDGPLQEKLRIPLEKVEWWTTEFPWGYTGDTADFTLTLWDDVKGRYAIYLFEFKKDDINKKALAEVLLYVPWVAQVLVNVASYSEEVEVYPILVGKDCRLKHIPEEYSLDLEYAVVPMLNNVIRKRRITVKPPVIFCYEIRDRDCVAVIKDDARGKKDVCYVKDLDLTRIDLRTRDFKPLPPTLTTTNVEKDFVVRKYLQGF
jgi:uncharacterized protein (DUF983 family)